jgi:hypothetical protein
MQQQQFKRFYNLAFALIVICSAFFVFKAAESLVQSCVIDTQKEQYASLMDHQRQFIYDKLVKAGKQDQADEFMHDPQLNTLGLFTTDDENGQPFGPKAVALDRRIQFCEDNFTAISVVTTLVAFVLAYFFFWYIALFSVRYVRGKADQEPVSPSK